jgi:photosystem II stability/assembly factor-like uncharacterized protein
VAKVPTGIEGQLNVTVTTPAGTSNKLSFTAIMPPTILNITPASGPAGTQIEITGAAFGPREGPTNYVSFNDLKPLTYDYWSEERIVAKVPQALTGKVAITVTTPVGTSNPVSFYVKQPDLRGVTAMGATAWAVGEHGAIKASNDGGSTWATQESGTTLYLYGVAAGSPSMVWAVGQGGIILKTTNGGTAWTPHAQGSTQTLYGIDAVDTTTAWSVGEAGTILKTTDGGATWNPQASGTGTTLFSISAVSSTTAWAVGAGGGILKTEDGATWIPQNSRVNATLYGASAIGPSTCWIVGEGGTILKTSDGGLTWTPQSCNTTATLRAVAAANPSICWAVGDGGAFKTTDGGLTWTPCGSAGIALYGLCAPGAYALAVGGNGTTLMLP